MAASTEDLTTQLQNRLNDENIPLKERLDIAQNAFCSVSLPILQKEEQVLSWILQMLQNENVEQSERIMLYNSLLFCFKSNRMKSFSGNIRSSEVSKMLHMVKYFDSYPDDLKDTIRRCCVEVISIPFFQRLFMCDVRNACDLASYYLLSIRDEKSIEDFTNVMDHLLYINKMCLLKGEFRYCFIKEVMPAISQALVHLDIKQSSDYYNKATCVFKEVLFYEPKFIENFVDINTEKTIEPTKELKSFSKKIKHLPSKYESDVVGTTYSLLLKSLIAKYPENYSLIFRFFTLLVSPLGIIVNQVRSVEMNPINNWLIDNSFVIVKTLVSILDESKIPLNCQLEDVTLQNWFIGLIIGLTNINNKIFSINFLEMITRVIEFNPLVIEPSSKVLTMIMLQIKNKEIKAAYIKLINTVIRGSSKLQRMQKFTSFFLQNMKDCLMVSCEEELSLEDVLPMGIAEEFNLAVVQLPHSQVLSVMKSFLFHLERDCLPLVEAGQSDTSVCINMEVICEMAFQLIQGTNIIDHSVPEIIKQKFKHILEEMQVLLKRFGFAFFDFHEDRLLHSYLLLCRGFGAVKLLFREYDNLEIVAPTEIDLEPTNICYVHNYMYAENWYTIAQSVLKHENCKAAQDFFELLVQKAEAVSQVEEGYEGPSTQVARYLLERADTPWLWDHLIVLASLFQSSELVNLVKVLINFNHSDQSHWISLLKDENFCENRQLMLATGLCLLMKGSEELCKEDEESVSFQVLSLIDLSSLLEYELSQMITEDVEQTTSVEDALEEMANVLNERLCETSSPIETIPNISVFEVPARLPLHHFSTLNQCCILYSTMSLLYQLPIDSKADMYLFNLLLKIMDGPRKNDKSLLGKLNPGIFLKFVGERGKNYRGQRKLMKRICLNAFKVRSSSKKLFKQVCSPDTKNLWMTAVVVDSLMQLKNKQLGSTEDKRKPLEKKECLDHLVSAILPVLKCQVPTSDHLYTFSVVFKYSIQHSRDSLQPLMGNLKEYIEFALADYKTGSILIESMIQHRGEIDDKDFPSWLMSRTWQLMRSELMEPQETVSHLIFETSTQEEFVDIIPALLHDTEKEMQNDIWDFRMANLFTLWCHLASSLLSSEKSNCRNKALSTLVTKLPTLALRWQEGRDYNIIPVIIELISTLANASSVPLRPVVLDSYMTILEVIPLPSDQGEVVIQHLAYCLDAMFALYLFRTSLLIDRLPVVMQRFRLYLTSLASVCDPSKSQDFLKTATPVAVKMERVATTMVKRQKDFARLAPYIIADLMYIFQQYNLSSEIKFSYTNIVNAFLSICDKHAISYLNGALPIGQQELFNNMYENFKKYNRFIGKI